MLRGLTMRDEMACDGVENRSFLGFGDPTFPGLKTQEEHLNDTLFGLRASSGLAVGIGTVVLVVCLIAALRLPHSAGPRIHSLSYYWLYASRPTIDGQLSYAMCLLGFVALSIVLSIGIGLTSEIWLAFRRLLARLSGGRLVALYGSDQKGNDGIGSGMPKLSISRSPRDLTAARQGLSEVAGLRDAQGEIGVLVKEALEQLDDIDRTLAKDQPDLAFPKLTNLRGQLARLATSLSGTLWPRDGSAPRWPLNNPPETQAAKRFLVLHLVDYCQLVAQRIRNIMICTTVGLLLVLLAVSSYPFANADSMLRLTWTLTLIAILVSVVVLIQMNRDRVLSVFSSGVPGQVDWNRTFVFHLVVLGLLPLLSLVGIRFPATLHGTVNWVSSLIQGAR
jgi:hypothetical protein